MSTPGLVMWEVVYRIQTSPSISPAYQPPYWDLVNLDPSLDEMRKVVCLDMMRPDTPADWETRLAQSGCRYFQIVIKYFCYAKKIFLSTSSTATDGHKSNFYEKFVFSINLNLNLLLGAGSLTAAWRG